MTDAADLTAKFEALGVPNPANWAKSQMNEGIDQLSRATVLRAMADIVVGSRRMPELFADADWVTDEVRNAARRINGAGVSSDDLTLIIKTAVYHSLSDMMVLFDDCAELENNPGQIQVGLFKLDDDFEPASPIEGLHESWNQVAGAIVGEDVAKI